MTKILDRSFSAKDLPAGLEAADVLIAIDRLIATADEANLKDIVGFSMCASESMAGTARLTGNVRETDSGLQSLATGMVEMASSINDVATNCGNAADMVSRVSREIARSSETTRAAAQETGAVGQQFGAMKTSITEVQEAAEQISSFVGTIEAIAQQTNLLALNATIEAARAGEAGRGFSIVAAEVKALSSQTSRATDDIRQRISKLQDNVESLINTVAGVAERVQANVSGVMAASSEIDRAQDDVRTADSYVREISDILRQQHAAVTEMSEKIQEISDTARQSATEVNGVISAVAGSEKIVARAFERLEPRNIPNYVLHRAKSDHVLWKKRLSEMLVGLNSLKSDELVSHNHCRLGKWYNAVDDQRLRQSPAFGEIARPHEDVHKHGIAAAKAYEGGDRKLALAEMERMEAASHKVLEKLEELLNR